MGIGKRQRSSVKGQQPIKDQRSLCATQTVNYAHIILRAEINGKTYSALLDSGAQGNFISPSIINRDEIPWHQKEDPYRLSTVEGTEVGYGNGVIDMETDHLPVSIQGHATSMTLDITDTAHHELILGLPWLRATNPRIDWTTGQIFWDNAVTQRRVAINGAGRSSVTEDSGEPRSNEPTDTSGSKSGTWLWKNREGSDQSWTPEEGRSLSDQQKRSGPPRTDGKTTRYSTTHRQEAQRYLLYIHQKGETMNDEPTDRLARVPRTYHEFRKVFQERLDTVLPQHSRYDHEIPLQEGKVPKYHQIYGLNEEQLKALREYLDENLEKQYIQPSKSPAGYPILFVPKKNGKLRLCVDYRQLNDITIKNRYPLPLIKELRDRLKGAQWFTALDLKHGYNLIRMKEGEEWKTAFRTRYGHYEYQVMPFGLTNAPATFQEMINDVLREYLDVFVIAYLDDILIFSKNPEEHKEHVKKVLQKLQDANLLVEPEKSFFHVQKVDYLGYTIEPGLVRMQKDKVQAIKEWPTPTSVKDVRAFQGYVNFYRQFIGGYSDIAKPLTDLTRKDVSFQWTQKEEQAFQALKDKVTQDPVLEEADPEKEFEIHTDASDDAAGGELTQRDDKGRVRIIANFSKKFNGPETRYATPDKEFMAIVYAFQEWQHYLIGAQKQIKLYTDHKNLTTFTTTKQLNKRQVRYVEFLSQFDIKVIHVEGTKNDRADALSRRPDHHTKESPPEWTVFKTEEDGSLTLNRELDVTIRIDKTPRGTPKDPEEQNKLIKEIHEAPAHGHQGVTATVKRIQRTHQISNLRRRTEEIIRQCDSCNKNKTSRHKPYGLLKPLPVPTAVWSSISLDFIVKLPLSREPLTKVLYDSILVVVCRLSKYAYFIPYKEASTAEELAYTFLRIIVSNHGMPQEIISDRDKLFTSNFWKPLMKQLGTKHKLSTAAHPQTDGQTERINQIVEQYLRHYVNQLQDNWVELLPLAQFAYNSATTSTTRQSPFFAVYGYEPQAYYESLPDTAIAESAEQKATRIRQIQKNIQDELSFVQERMAKYANQKRIEGPILKEGDKVYLLRQNIKTKYPSNKLNYKKIKLFKILRKLLNTNYKLLLLHRIR